MFINVSHGTVTVIIVQSYLATWHFLVAVGNARVPIGCLIYPVPSEDIPGRLRARRLKAVKALRENPCTYSHHHWWHLRICVWLILGETDPW